MEKIDDLRFESIEWWAQFKGWEQETLDKDMMSAINAVEVATENLRKEMAKTWLEMKHGKY